MADDRIKKFVDLHHEAEKFLNQNKVKDAKQKYLEVVNAYHDIHNSDLERFHKDIAYDQVTTLFKQVSEAKERIKVPVNMIVAACLIIVFSVAVAIQPSIVGLVSFQDTVRQPVDKNYTESGLDSFTLRDRPLNLKLSGKFDGSAKVFFKQGEKLELVFDSEVSPSQEGVFIDVCEETCDINVKSNSIELFIQVDEGTLTLDELVYDVERTDNTAPEWTGKKKTLNAVQGQPLILDLDNYFKDDEDDPLTYLSTTTEGLEVDVKSNVLTITPHEKGKKTIMLIASDLLDLTRVRVTIDVK